MYLCMIAICDKHFSRILSFPFYSSNLYTSSCLPGHTQCSQVLILNDPNDLTVLTGNQLINQSDKCSSRTNTPIKNYFLSDHFKSNMATLSSDWQRHFLTFPSSKTTSRSMCSFLEEFQYSRTNCLLQTFSSPYNLITVI